MVAGKMDLVSWMREKALPFWALNGVDYQNGGFVEELNQDGSPSKVPFKRVRVQGRQLYSFSNAAILGWNKDAAAIADHGYEFLKKACRAQDGHWVRKLGRDGSILDSQIDLYDTAFVVLGLATYYRLTQKSEALNLIGSTLDMVRAQLGTLSRKGYRQSPGDTETLRQNPHMHWFECMLFCFEVAKDDCFLDEAKRIYSLAEEYFFDAKTGALREVFDAQWKPLYEDGKILVEPGHHYEWVWLLSQAGKVMDVNPQIIPRILAFAERAGVNSTTGLVYDQVSDKGVVTQPTHRLWAQTEALKAWLVRTDVNESDRELGIQKIESNLLRRYFGRGPVGSWCDRLDADGRIHDGPVPASSMYHILLCVTEVWAWRSYRRVK
jgi:mannose/cellobiose epimerase-like protein (N-acyl-D-glucosamine 2-epimerase family)